MRRPEWIRRVGALLLLVLPLAVQADDYMLIPMDLKQTNHLKAYGLAYRMLTQGVSVEWLLNYRGGAFLARRNRDMELEARIRNIAYETVDPAAVALIKAEIEQ